jgi:hypothetical protein
MGFGVEQQSSTKHIITFWVHAHDDQDGGYNQR